MNYSTNNTPYLVGLAQHPSLDDPCFETEPEAIAHAQRQALGNQVYAVWHWPKGKEPEVICLIYQGDTYTS